MGRWRCEDDDGGERGWRRREEGMEWGRGRIKKGMKILISLSI